MTAFAQQTTEVLLLLRENLKRGLSRVAETIEDGTFHLPTKGENASPAQAGQLTLLLLQQVDAELTNRGHESILAA